jgi:23S rRNA pseudouridine2457 synthase
MAIYALNKPFGVLSQFSNEGARAGLGTLSLGLPRDAYAIGRLDADSEGLLLLSDEREMNGKLLDPQRPHGRTYWVQVEGTPTAEILMQLRQPLDLKIQGKAFRSRACEVQTMAEPAGISARIPPIRVRHAIPTAWLRMVLQEGKNRQVRKMTAAVGLPTLRLIRAAWGPLELATLGLLPGEVRILTASERNQLLGT